MSGEVSEYKKAYNKLNREQKQAVDKLDGPLLVLAGPGTGKTQLLTTRIGRILEQTDALPENILCLTFSDAAVKAMKERLSSLIGPMAHEVTVSTYHAFGNELISRYPDLFGLSYDAKPADELLLDKIMRKTQAKIDYSNPLKDDFYLKDIKSLISGYKRALIKPEDLKKICSFNEDFIIKATKIVNSILKPTDRVNPKLISAFTEIASESLSLPNDSIKGITPLKELWLEELNSAIDFANETNKTSLLTKWKNKWLDKDRSNKFVVNSPKTIRKQRALAEIFEIYNQELVNLGLYDYDDMIMLAINGLENNPDIKYTLQERYLYLQLDEFQDTNEAQLRLISLLADSPINEGRPNMLAVGDDDQAIYSFQGAHYSHMERFKSMYKDVEIIALKTNYRSTPGIIGISSGIRNQIKEGLTISSKEQESANHEGAEEILRAELPLDVEQLAWSAKYIASLIKDGTSPNEITVLAPKHQNLVDFIPYLHAHNISVNYEQKDNILEDPLINQVLSCAKLVLSIDDQKSADCLWPIVLSQDHWQIPTSEIWNMSWIANKEHNGWTKLLLDNELTRAMALFFIRLNQIAKDTPFELMLNYIIGIDTLELNELKQESFRSPFYEHYFKNLERQDQNIQAGQWKLLGHLSILRAKALSTSETYLSLNDFMTFIEDYKNAALKIIDSTPFRESRESVNLMTAYASKGREFDTIVLIDAVDNVWGHSSKRQSNKITLPINLKHVNLDLNSDDEKLRLLFVATSRAKRRLIITSYSEGINGKQAEHLSYLNEYIKEDKIISPLLPKTSCNVAQPSKIDITIDNRVPSWYDRHLNESEPSRRALLTERLDNLGLTATNLNNFTNVIDGGPVQFYLDEILRFPKSQAPRSEYGSAIHNTLDWQFKITKQNLRQPTLKQILEQFEMFLSQKRLSHADYTQLLKKGKGSLTEYLKQASPILNSDDLSEESFSSMLGKARLKGMIDRLKVDKANKKIHIVDFKTGKTYDRWNDDTKPFHHKRQLYFYKLLVESSPKFKDYIVSGASIEFVEPDEDDGQIRSLELIFNDDELQRLKLLIVTVWHMIMDLNFPQTETFSKDVKGILAFEETILKQNKIKLPA